MMQVNVLKLEDANTLKDGLKEQGFYYRRGDFVQFFCIPEQKWYHVKTVPESADIIEPISVNTHLHGVKQGIVYIIGQFLKIFDVNERKTYYAKTHLYD